MPQLAERQREFAHALLDPRLPIPPGLVDPDGEPSESRFAVYRNNVVSGLIDVLQASFPAVHRIVGPEFFRAMARVFVAGEPPDSPILLGYGANFPDFIGAFEPAATLPYLRDVARIEHAWVEAYHAADAAPLDVAAFAQFAPQALCELRLHLSPSVRLLRCRFPALTIWRMNLDDGVPAPVDLDAGGENVLVARAQAEVELRSLGDDSAEFVQTLIEGLSLMEATTRALTANSAFDPVANITALLQSGIVVGYDTTADSNARVAEACP